MDAHLRDDEDLFIVQPPPEGAGALYQHWCLNRISIDFPRAKILDLKNALKAHQGRLAPSYKAVATAYDIALRKEQKLPVEKNPPRTGIKKVQRIKWLPSTGLKLMKNERCFPEDLPALCPIFEAEWALLQNSLSSTSEARHGLEVHEIQCGCCCLDLPFEEMVQCADGHLFCFTCLRRRVEESTFGGLPACGPLSCMEMGDCTASIPWSEIQRAIQCDLLLKFERRQASDSVARARLHGLIYCPFCSVACELDPGITIFKCPNQSCQKESCVKCKELSHCPLRCEQVEKPSETCIRREIEEVMSEALIRQCPSCKAQLLKDNGCNKLTCRCGQAMCYVCRQPIKDYKHFCQHTRDPGEACKTCKQCGLWDMEDENVVVKNAKISAVKRKAGEDPSIFAREIGPPETFFANKQQKT